MTVFDPHEIIPGAYKGREQAYIKHVLLEGYLERLLYIVGWNAKQLHYNEIVFVDCFAGPWQDDSDDMSSTSISISLRLLSKIQNALGKAGQKVKFRAIYVEKDRKAFTRLNRFLSENSPPNISTEAIQGDFSEKIPDILSRCKEDSFAFFFIDPKGWLIVQPDVLHNLLKRPGSEFLINFMYDFVNRFVSVGSLKEQIGGLFDSTVDFDNLPDDPQDRQKYLVEKYRSAIVSRATISSSEALSGYVTILDPLVDKTKYHLIYLTRHPLGVIEFMEQSEKIQGIQDNVRTAVKLQKISENSGMDDLFGVDTLHQSNSIKKSNTQHIEDYWLEVIGDRILTVTQRVFAQVLAHTNCFPSELQIAMKKLLDQGRVINLDVGTSRRRTKFVDYEKKERFRKK